MTSRSGGSQSQYKLIKYCRLRTAEVWYHDNGKCSARCLVVNARSLVDFHKMNGKNPVILWTSKLNLRRMRRSSLGSGDVVKKTKSFLLKSFFGATSFANVALVEFSLPSSPAHFHLPVKLNLTVGEFRSCNSWIRYEVEHKIFSVLLLQSTAKD